MITLNSMKSKFVAGATGLTMMASMVMAPAASAAILGGNNDLGDLFVLDQLFAGDGSVFGNDRRTVVVVSGDTLSAIAARELGDASRFSEIADANDIANPNLIFPGQVLVIPSSASSASTNLGDLFILDRLFDNGSGVLSGGDNDLGDLLVLDQLFGSDNGIFGGMTGDSSNLGNLIILDELFNNDSIIGGNGIMDSDNDLGDLIILDKLFGTSNGFLGGVTGDSSNLGNLFILDKLFD
ncbi:MAG: LysM peptidoglycan-binding domain-containing protein [Candidatus Portnoybacteria bacterium]|nr:LysM peptidoglycan-binding domain-containing protein [Candidatus Portnoybacteria bacterium]